jgi:hypothetical protein
MFGEGEKVGEKLGVRVGVWEIGEGVACVCTPRT